MTQDHTQEAGYKEFIASLHDVNLPGTRVYHFEDGQSFTDNPFQDPSVKTIIQYRTTRWNDDYLTCTIHLFKRQSGVPKIREITDSNTFKNIKKETAIWDVTRYWDAYISSWETIQPTKILIDINKAKPISKFADHGKFLSQ